MTIYFAGNGGAEGPGEGSVKYFLQRILCGNDHLFSYYYFENSLGMDIYFAGGENKSWIKAIEDAEAKKSLFSYFYSTERSTDLELGTHCQNKQIFLDSGGYSAWSKGVPIDIDRYIAYIKKNKEHIHVYAVLDDINNEDQTLENQYYMEEKGLNPLPCFHYDEDWELLKHYVSEYDYICLGGLVPHAKNKPKLKKFLDKAFSIITTDAKVHGFGMTGVEIMKRYPFYSVDSTSWLGGAMRSEINKFYRGDMLTIKTKQLTKKTNIDSVNLADKEEKLWYDRVVHNCVEWKKMESFITELWDKRGITWN